MEKSEAIVQFFLLVTTAVLTTVVIVNPWQWPWYGLIAFCVGGISTGVLLALIFENVTD